MLPPIPSGVFPVSAQQDAVKPRPDIQPVAPVEPAAGESAIALDRRHPQETEQMLRDEQRRRQRRGSTPGEKAPDLPNEGDARDDADERPRQGRWVDVEV